MGEKIRNKTKTWLAIILAFTLALRLSLALGLPLGFWIGGEETYIFDALRDGGNPLSIVTYQLGPLYLFLFQGLQSFLLWRAVNAILGTISVLLVYLVVAEFSTERKALACSAFTALLPTHIIFTSQLGLDALSMVLSIAFALFFLKTVKTISFKFWLLASAFMFLAFLSKPTTYFLLIPFLLGTAFIFSATLKLKWLLPIPIAFTEFILFIVKNINWVSTSFPSLASRHSFLQAPVLKISALFTSFFIWLPSMIVQNWGAFLGFTFFSALCAFSFLGLVRNRKFNFAEKWALIFIIANFAYVLMMDVFLLEWQGRYMFPSLWAVAYFFCTGLLKSRRRESKP